MNLRQYFIMNVPIYQLSDKFQAFRSLFNSWGYQISEDTELASAYLSISDLGPDDVKTKMTIIIDGLKNYLEYPLVAAAILTSIATLEANETLDLMEKAYSLLGSFAAGLERSELISLSVRMIHGIKNGLVKEIDPTAKITPTPVQFTYVPSNLLLIYYAPLISRPHIHLTIPHSAGLGAPTLPMCMASGVSWADLKVVSCCRTFTQRGSLSGARCRRLRAPSGRLFQLPRS